MSTFIKHKVRLYSSWCALFIVHCSLFIIYACSSSNCPLESTVTCNYGFYDTNGTPVAYNDTMTVSTLLPGTKDQYTYRRMGYSTITSDTRIDSLLEKGYTETVTQVRRDTILGNRLVGLASMKLPMHYFAERDTIIIRYASLSRRDTLHIHHLSYSNVDLPECGTHRFHTLLDIQATDAAIDHIEIVNPTVNYLGNENVKIYFNGTVEEE